MEEEALEPELFMSFLLRFPTLSQRALIIPKKSLVAHITDWKRGNSVLVFLKKTSFRNKYRLEDFW